MLAAADALNSLLHGSEKPKEKKHQMQSLKPMNLVRRTRNLQQRSLLARTKRKTSLNVSLVHRLDLVNAKRKEAMSLAKLQRERKHRQRHKTLKIRRTLMVTHPGKTFQSLCKTHMFKVVAGVGIVHIVQSLAGSDVVTNHDYFYSLCRLFC